MSYIDGFVIAVPTANKQQFIAHADRPDGAFIDHGARRVVECWGVDVPRGRITDFQRAVAATDDETVAFSWIEWPDRFSRDNVMKRMDELGKTDERFDPAANPMPFDGKRMIYGGFETLVEHGKHSRDSYVEGFIVPVRTVKRDAYGEMAEETWHVLEDYGALRVVEAWDDDVPAGTLTDFYRAVQAKADEKVVFSFIEWPSREVCDAAGEKMKTDKRMQLPEGTALPFDAQRMIYGGFARVVTLER